MAVSLHRNGLFCECLEIIGIERFGRQFRIEVTRADRIDGDIGSCQFGSCASGEVDDSAFGRVVSDRRDRRIADQTVNEAILMTRP